MYGALCGRGAADAARHDAATTCAALPGALDDRARPTADDRLDVADLTNSLRSLMVRKMGIVRDRDAAARGEATTCDFWCRYVLAREFDGRAGWELQNLLTVARLMIDVGAGAGGVARDALPQRLPDPRRRRLGIPARR